MTENESLDSIMVLALSRIATGSTDAVAIAEAALREVGRSFKEPQFIPLWINIFMHEVLENSKRHGFCHPTSLHETSDVCAQLMLIVSEAAEACEEVRFAAPDPARFASELADIILRTGILTVSLGIDLEGAILAKHEKNRNRPFLHGGKTI